MLKNRLEAFSDGVIAIIITIMVLELRAPHETDLASLKPLLPIFLSYILSFIYIAIYWNNHHHLLHAINRIDGKVLWANIHLLFWLSLIPFTTSWIDENTFLAPWPAAVYGIVLFGAAGAYYILTKFLLACQGQGSAMASALRDILKERISIAIYAFAILFAFVKPAVSYALYALVAAMWIVPDRRLEKILLK
ncbi:MAG: hypothetical protein A2Z88_09075 [Omnitrophica WOR_2 bacterium GWA2_47_8]|nr:MAG: hypothetical protein A2Z88_09075 [Omnitrophica WOR_2 bacterium GWA2_47_8]